MALNKDFNDILLTQVLFNDGIRQLLSQRRIYTLSQALELLQQMPAKTTGFPLAYLLKMRRDFIKQGYLLYGPWDDTTIPSQETRLAWLADIQEANGSWCPEGFEPPTTEMPEFSFTIAATLSFIRAGHTSKQGKYASKVAAAIQWLETDRSLPNSTLAYGLLCVLAENYGMPSPEPTFEVLPLSESTTFDQIRQWALVKGNAPLEPWQFVNWSDPAYLCHEYTNVSNQGIVTHNVQMAWMTVGAPRLISS